MANKGTLLLDEIENLSLNMQIKLLRALQERQITKVGGSTPITVDVRVIASTNKNLQSLITTGAFREDLYYRMNVVNIKIPPLRERAEDIPLLVRAYLAKIDSKMTVEKQVMEILQCYLWPGNIRELHNAIERACIMASGKTIKVSDLPLEIVTEVQNNNNQTKCGYKLEINDIIPLKDVTREYISYVLKQNEGNITKTASQLGITRPTIYSIINDK